MVGHDKVILVTGVAGFIASHVARMLVINYPNYKIIGLDKLCYCASKNNMRDYEGYDNFEFIKGNILDESLVFHILSNCGVTHIMHFAAQTHVDNSFGNALTFTENNTKGTHVLLECSVKYGKLSCFLHVSTDEVYGLSIDKDESSDENAALIPTNPYSASKLAAECMVQAYGTSYNLPYIITRGNNVYGPGQFPEKLIPKSIILLSEGGKVPIHGTGNNKRTYLYIDDVVSAFDVILHNGEKSGIYNISGDIEYRNNDIVETLQKMLRGEDNFYDCVEYVSDRKFNDIRYNTQSDALKKIGWKGVQVDIDIGLERTKDWYIANYKDWWPNELTKALQPHSD
jgi:UDP-glucose 4,6-dehydratase